MEKIQSERAIGLDALRALAITLVVAGHVVLAFLPQRQILAWTLFPDGVSLFFSLSGFLITRSLIEHVENGGWLLHYWLKRVIRTMPPFFVALGLYGLISTGPAVSPLSYVFMQNMAWDRVGGFAEGWSLSVEEWYYALLLIGVGALAMLRFRTALLLVSGALIAVSLVYRFDMSASAADIANTSVTVLGRLDAPAFGVLAAVFSRSRLLRSKSLLWFGLAATWALQAFTAHLFVSPAITTPVFFWLHPSLSSLFWAMTLVPASRMAGDFVGSSAVRQIARSAFSIYLTHYSIVLIPLLPLVAAYPKWQQVTAFLVLAAVASQAFYWTVERPFVKARKLVDIVALRLSPSA